jgi:hypothetical protein
LPLSFLSAMPLLLVVAGRQGYCGAAGSLHAPLSIDA